DCPRRIFAERFEGLLASGARRTNEATNLLTELGLRAGAEGGARLARRAGVPTSPDTLLRLVKMLGVAAVPAPRVLGVDDFRCVAGRVTPRCASIWSDTTLSTCSPRAMPTAPPLPPGPAQQIARAARARRVARW